MSNSNETISADSNSINTKRVVAVICLIVLVVIGFYFVNFHSGLSGKNEVWGTFGDYFGGILNPVIAAFAFYLIAKTYELQKTELEATRSLLEVSTNAQKDQIKLAALTALLNSNLMRIDTLNAESFVYKGKLPLPQKTTMVDRIQEMERDRLTMATNPGLDRINTRLDDIESEIEKLQFENISLEEQIKIFLNTQ